MPLEAYLTRAVFHHHVHPTSTFVCLWSRFSKTDTMVEALCQLQRILTYAVVSESPDDVMQPHALKWAIKEERGSSPSSALYSTREAALMAGSKKRRKSTDSPPAVLNRSLA